MSEPLHIAEVRSYTDLQLAMRVRADHVNISRETLDEISGLTKGYCSKILAPVPMRRLGPETMGPLLQALGLKLLVVDDPEAYAKYTARAAERNDRQVRTGAKHTAAVLVKIKPRFLKKIGAIGGKNSRKYISSRKASALGRKAMRARWRKWKAKRKARAAVGGLKTDQPACAAVA